MVYNNFESSDEMINDDYKLTTEEARRIIEELKKKVNESNLTFPQVGKKIEFEVFSKKDGTKYIINISRSIINKEKCTFQGRTYINNIPLLRLDITNGTHMNSDGTKITGNHLHIYNEDAEMHDAIPFEIDNPDLYKCCLEFFKRFNVIKENWDIYYQEEI